MTVWRINMEQRAILEKALSVARGYLVQWCETCEAYDRQHVH